MCVTRVMRVTCGSSVSCMSCLSHVSCVSHVSCASDVCASCILYVMCHVCTMCVMCVACVTCVTRVTCVTCVSCVSHVSHVFWGSYDIQLKSFNGIPYPPTLFQHRGKTRYSSSGPSTPLERRMPAIYNSARDTAWHRWHDTQLSTKPRRGFVNQFGN